MASDTVELSHFQTKLPTWASNFQLSCNLKYIWTYPVIWNWYAATLNGP